MFKKNPQDPSGLETAIDELLLDMKNAHPTSDEYSAMTDNLVKIYKLKEVDTSQRVSPDTKFVIAGNLAGILLIVCHERAHVLTSKALTILPKLR